MEDSGATSGTDLWRRAALLGLLVSALGCASAEDAGDNAGIGNPWVRGGQTGGLMPDCGLSPAAEAGSTVPGGDGGIVIYTAQCGPDFDLAELELLDAEGNRIAFAVEELGDGTVLLRPTQMLDSGLYTVGGISGPRASVSVAPAPAELPMHLGSLVQRDVGCGASFTLALDPLVLEYLPQLKLSVRVDGGPLETWFDFGTLDETDGEARVVLPECVSSCFDAPGTYELEVVAELAGELGTLEPLETTFVVDCPEEQGGGSGSSGLVCAAAPSRGPPGSWLALAGVACALALLLRRRGASG